MKQCREPTDLVAEGCIMFSKDWPPWDVVIMKHLFTEKIKDVSILLTPIVHSTRK